MTNRERIVCALEGGTPDVVPLTSYEWMWDSEDEGLLTLVEQGLGPTRHVGTCAHNTPGLDCRQEEFQRDGHSWRRVTMSNPAGTVEELYMDGWRQEFFIKEPKDYAVFEWTARHTELKPVYDTFEQAVGQVDEGGIVCVSAPRSPIQSMLVDWTGLERFCYHLADEVQELYGCYEAVRDGLYREMEIIAAGPGRYVKMWENFTAETFGVERFREFHLPVYERCGAMLHAGQKRVFAHMDGRLARVSGVLEGSGLDGLESLTPPSEGDVPPQDWRRLWPNLVLWVNIPVSWYYDPAETLTARIHDLLARVGQRRGLLMEISEDLPRNWKESVPVALEALATA